MIAQLDEIQVELRRIGGVQHVYLNGEDVSEQIRTDVYKRQVGNDHDL